MGCKQRCESCWTKFVDVLPLLFLGGLIGWSYYAYVVHLCLHTITDIPEKVIYLVFYHLILLMMLWSLFEVVFSMQRPIPVKFYLTPSEVEQYEAETTEVGRIRLVSQKAQPLPLHCRTSNGDIRFCEPCKCIKPDRAHHCSKCNRCVLKMDHHCLWVNSCIGFHNYKLFVLLIAYACLYCAFIAVTSLQFFIRFWINVSRTKAIASDLQTVILFILAVVIAISLGALLSYHCHIIHTNQTTIEFSYAIPVFVHGPDRNGFNHGKHANFIDVFGERRLLWFIPVFSGCGDGINYARNLLSQSTTKYKSVDGTRLSLQPPHPVRTTTHLVQPPTHSSSEAVEPDDAVENGIANDSSERLPIITPIKQQT